jgi:hypothetical protein
MNGVDGLRYRAGFSRSLNFRGMAFSRRHSIPSGLALFVYRGGTFNLFSMIDTARLILGVADSSAAIAFSDKRTGPKDLNGLRWEGSS